MIKKLFISFLVFFLGYTAFLFLYPNINRLKKENPRKTSFMKYREGEAMEKGRSFQVRQYWVPLSRISPFLIKAVIIAEDDKFWVHEGFDFEAIQKAIEKDLKSGKFKVGGSTISQQLAKNLYLTPTKSLWRKYKEAILTWRIERSLSKKRIIELYLNLVEWGEGIFGAEAAARVYFRKSAASLTPEEAARLAVVLPNPRKWNPTGPSSYVYKRAKVILNIMTRRGIVIPTYEELMSPGKDREGAQEGSEIPVPDPKDPISEPANPTPSVVP